MDSNLTALKHVISDRLPDAQCELGSPTGNNLPNNPKTEYNVSAEYTFPMANGSDLATLGVYSWRGEFDAYVSNNEDKRSASYDRFDLNATWTAPGKAWSVSVFGHNVFNEQELELFEYLDYEWEDPETGEEVFVLVDDPSVSGWRYWAPKSALPTLIDRDTTPGVTARTLNSHHPCSRLCAILE